MSRLFATGVLVLFCCGSTWAQQDSLKVSQSVWVNVSGDIQIKDARSYEIQEIGYKRTKGSSTLVANLARKSNPFLSGAQFGLSYFRSWKGGYYNLSAYGSASQNFPRLVTVAEGYFNLPGKFELRLGVRHNQAVVPFSIASLGLNNYIGKFYLGYTFHWVTNQSTYHTGFLRFYPERRVQMVEIAFGSAALEELVTQQLYLDQRVQCGLVMKVGAKVNVKAQAGLSLTQAEVDNPKVFLYQLGLSKSF